MFFGRQNNNTNAVNVNTKLYSSFSDTCMITMSAWNQQISLKFHPAKGVNADGLRQYAQDTSEIINTSLTPANADLLLKGIEDVIEPAISEKGKASVSIPISSGENKKILTLSVDGEVVKLSIALHVNEQDVADSSNVLSHEFPRKQLITGYDHESGAGNKITVNTDYIGFKENLKSIHKLTPVVPHTINYSNALKSSFSNRNGSNNMSQGSNNQGGYSAPTISSDGDNMGEFLPFQ